MFKRTFFFNFLPKLLFFAIIILFTVSSIYHFPGAGRDDVYITLWAGETIGSSPWFTNYNGDLQEMSSSIIGAFVFFFCKQLFPDATFLANKLLGLFASVITLLIVWVISRRIFSGLYREYLASICVMLTAASPVFQYWTMGGLETPYQTLIMAVYLLLLLVFHEKVTLYSSLLLSVPIILYFLVRPEGFWLLFLNIFLIYFLFYDRKSIKIFSISIIIPASLFFSLIFLRYRFTDNIFPNPVYSKVDLGSPPIILGVKYLYYYYSSGIWPFFQFLSSVVASSIVLYASFINKSFGRKYFILIVISLLIIFQEFFILMVGGNWMEYYRFIVPTLPFKNILIISAISIIYSSFSKRLNAQFSKVAYMTFFIICLFFSLSQMGINGFNPLWKFGSGNCSQKLPSNFFDNNLIKMNDILMKLNSTYRRDYIAIYPFIKNHLKTYVDLSKKINLVTSQAGFFPYMLRKHFGVNEVFIIDSIGLVDSKISSIPVKKNCIGNYSGVEIDKILLGELGELSEKILGYEPNMVYVVRVQATEQFRKNLKKIGFFPVWDKPGAVVFYNGIVFPH